MKAFRHSIVLALLSLLSLISTAHAASTTVVISQVYGGGGNSGATYKNDFIELHNISGSAVSVAGWSVQYNSATGTSAYQVTTLSGSIPAGGYFLVQEAAGAGGTTNLPTPDATGSLNISGTTGRVALVNNTTALAASSAANATGIVDFVGFGSTANTFEGTGPTPAPGNATSVTRKDNGSTDTDSNVNDFTAGTVSPRNSASATYVPGPVASKVSVESLANGSGVVVPAQTVSVNQSITVYAVTRTAANAFVANAAATWTLTSLSGGVVAGDLVPAGDNKSAVFTPHAGGSAVIHAAISGLTSEDSGTINATALPTNPTAVASSSATDVINGQSITLTVTVTPGANPTSSGISVTGDLSALGGSATQSFTAGAGNTFTSPVTIPSALAGGAKVLNFAISDAQSRTGTATLTLNLRGSLTIFHTNDTHARVTPHKWVVPQHSTNPTSTFDDVGGIAYMGSKILSLVAGTPDALVLDGGDISEGNPIGDWNGPGYAPGAFGDGTIVDYYKMLHAKLKTIPGRGGRGLDAQVVGNHDIRDISYLNNLKAAAYDATTNPGGYHLLSMNICVKGTHNPYYEAYTTITLNGNKIGIIGYTTESADSPETDVNNAIDVVKCDWSSTDSTKIHFADIVNELRNNQGCNMVILLTHMGHSGLCTPTGANPTPILVDNAVAKLPEIVVSGHWHTYCETVWQPVSLNYKTIFTEAGSFQHYVGELRVNGLGKYAGATYYPLRNSDITPDADLAAYVAQRKIDYANASPTYDVDQVIGYTADNLLLDNYMKWWSADEYPWSGNNTAGNWICDAVKWKAAQLFAGTGGCDLSLEAGGGVRSDIVAGPIKYTNIYETFPWADDTIYVVNMTGQQIWDYFKTHNCDAAMSAGWHVTAYDGVPTAITYNGSPIGLTQVYKVAINNYMYLHDSADFPTIDPSPQTSTYLARTALVEYTATFPSGSPYQAGPSRYTLNTDFSGGYRAVVMMMNDADTREAFEDGFIRILGANAETLAHRGTPQVPNDLINADGSANRANRLTENEWYRSYLGFKNSALLPGDIVEVWGKGAFFGGNPEFVDQEGVQSDGVEFKVIGHDDSLALPTYFSSINGFWNEVYKNHYVKFVAKKTTSSTVTDKSGMTITIQDKTGYATKTLPGSVGDYLVITGVPTSESYALRFRCDNAVLASSLGLTGAPPDSHVDALTYAQSSSPLTIAATADVAPGTNQNFYIIEPAADVQVASGHATTNYGTGTNANNIYVQSAASGFGNERGWLRFNLSTVPAGATISSATLNMYCWKHAGASLPTGLHSSADDSWSETAMTWNTQPAFNGTASSTLTLASEDLWYAWDASAIVQGEFAGDKVASMLVKPVTENSADTTSPSYAFDTKDYTSNHPYLKITTPATGTPVTLTQVQFFYRYSADNTSWGAWTAFQTVSASPWTASFTYPSGNGYYEFYSVATDSAGNAEPVPPYADSAVHFVTGPVLAVAQGSPLTNGASVAFGNAGANLSTTRTFTLSNPGTQTLTITAPTVDGANPSDFVVTTPPAASINPGDSSTMVVTFTPGAPNARAATVHLASNDPSPANNPFNIALTGNGVTNFEAWREQHYGNSGNSADAADDAQPKHDGVSNLMKFATGMDPDAPGTQPGSAEKTQSTFTFTYTRSKAAVADGVVFTVEWTDSLGASSWSSAGVSEVSAVDQGATHLVTVSVPAGTDGHRFVHLRVSR